MTSRQKLIEFGLLNDTESAARNRAIVEKMRGEKADPAVSPANNITQEVIKDVVKTAIGEKPKPGTVQVTEEEVKKLGIKLPTETVQDHPGQSPEKTKGQLYYETYVAGKGLITPWQNLGTASRAAYERKADETFKTRHRKHAARDWERVKADVLADYQNSRLRDFYVRWGLNSSRWLKLKKLWGVTGKFGRSYNGGEIKPVIETAMLPPWNEAWGDAVKVAWLAVIKEMK